ncbi:hypothetical protein J7E68_08765 [Microbacterium sp. ISL-103]|uniref:hypothetical protein n=1 Tax=Microbacterium sp. ISL-103 TaxID=2819156 RepID=UPI001BE98D3D|nr:hypothetical protein [Microbacterium sp. ISL-103]MBT2474662.1 hypothetical protein [Microbacterium sp. ISL-103]
MAQTKARQQTVLGEGLALGALILGCQKVHGNRMALEFDFRRAWRAWPYTHLFPAVKVGPAQDDLFGIMQDSAGRRSTRPTYWEGAWPFTPVMRFDWTADEIAEHLSEEIPADAWRELVEAWLQPPEDS